MASTSMFLLTVTCILAVIGFSESAPLLVSEPSKLQLGMTRTLTVNCSISNLQSSSLLGIVSLALTRNSSGQDPVHLASVNSLLEKSLIQYPASNNATTDGLINNVSGEAYLSLAWTYPSSDYAGVYKCTIHALDTDGLSVSIEETTEVVAEKPDKNFLVDTVLKLLRQVDADKRKTASFKEEVLADVKELEETVSKNADSVSGHEEEIQSLKEADRGLEQRLTNFEYRYGKKK